MDRNTRESQNSILLPITINPIGRRDIRNNSGTSFSNFYTRYSYFSSLRHIISSLGHNSVHKGTFDNNLAVETVKQVTRKHSKDTDFPESQFEVMLRVLGYFNKEQHIFKLIPKVSLQLYKLMAYMISFLTGYGPFVACLEIFKCTFFSLCLFDELGTACHAYFHCELMGRSHIKRPASPPKVWLYNILTRTFLLNKLKHIHIHFFKFQF